MQKRFRSSGFEAAFDEPFPIQLTGVKMDAFSTFTKQGNRICGCLEHRGRAVTHIRVPTTDLMQITNMFKMVAEHLDFAKLADADADADADAADAIATAFILFGGDIADTHKSMGGGVGVGVGGLAQRAVNSLIAGRDGGAVSQSDSALLFNNPLAMFREGPSWAMEGTSPTSPTSPSVANLELELEMAHDFNWSANFVKTCVEPVTTELVDTMIAAKWVAFDAEDGPRGGSEADMLILISAVGVTLRRLACYTVLGRIPSVEILKKDVEKRLCGEMMQAFLAVVDALPSGEWGAAPPSGEWGAAITSYMSPLTLPLPLPLPTEAVHLRPDQKGEVSLRVRDQVELAIRWHQFWRSRDVALQPPRALHSAACTYMRSHGGVLWTADLCDALDSWR
jgi:hypothetical protein